jgi:hypothetical protein
MSRSANSLRASDVITTPIKLKYSSSFESSSFAANGITVLKGVNGPVTITGSIPQETLNYYSIRHLYYSNYLTGSYPVSASSADNYLQSTAASGTLDADVRYFPTESGAEITIFSIPRNVFGQQISRQSFKIASASMYSIVDDGNGNLIDQFNSSSNCANYTVTKLNTFLTVDYITYVDCNNVSQSFTVENPSVTDPESVTFFAISGSVTHDPAQSTLVQNGGISMTAGYVGNLIYPQGMAIITNPAYQFIFP